ncbi:hypothetical protein DSO57_1015400 [Entomophthora muscae]|uniref:Uncharacterized protein n=1 Tax=Entomophthora muscae TaxID=34485 RepID=A0ACC2SI03_9FUNG|nr:hypothetical protein DSO57_1015400 [Entomophthora muscae]
MMEKVKPVLNTIYKPYISDGNQEDSNKPKFYRTTEGKLVLKKVAVFYTKVPMPCKPVTNQDPGSSELTKPAQKRIPNIKRIILLKLMQESGDYKEAAALVWVDPKYASKTFNTFIETGQVLAAEKSLCVLPVTVGSIMPGIIRLSKKAQKAGKLLSKLTKLTD